MAEAVSILIITRERREMLDRLLSDLADQDYLGAVEIVVVEETDSPRKIPGVVYVPHPILNKGIAFARNLSVQHASHDLLVFVDDDCRVSPDWLSKLVVPFEDETVLGAQGGVTVPEDTNAIGWAETLLGFPGGGYSRIIKSDGEIHDTLEISTLNAVYRKSVILEVDGFSNAARFGGEDFLLARKVAERGRLVFIPQAEVRHEARGSMAAIWYWFMRRGKAEFEINQANLAPTGYGSWMLRSSASIKIFPFILLCYWSLIPILGLLAGIALVNWWRFYWVIFHKNIPRSAWFVLPWVKLSMGVATDVGRFKAWWGHE